MNNTISLIVIYIIYNTRTVLCNNITFQNIRKLLVLKKKKKKKKEKKRQSDFIFEQSLVVNTARNFCGMKFQNLRCISVVKEKIISHKENDNDESQRREVVESGSGKW